MIGNITGIGKREINVPKLYRVQLLLRVTLGSETVSFPFFSYINQNIQNVSNLMNYIKNNGYNYDSYYNIPLIGNHYHFSNNQSKAFRVYGNFLKCDNYFLYGSVFTDQSANSRQNIQITRFTLKEVL